MEPLNIPGIQNGYKVDGVIWRGAQPAESAWPLLAAAGCKSVVDLNNLFPERDRQANLVTATGMTYASQLWGGILPPTQKQIKAALWYLDRLETPVFIHCLHGSDRTGTLCACWRMYHDGWTFERAIEEAFTSLGLQGMHEFWMAAAVAQYAHEQAEKH